jgi:dephospho-CoA kinase
VLRVGLTGGIGAGKSTVATELAGLGAVVLDADRVARDVVAPGTAGLSAVVREFGDRMLAPDASLDRPALAAVVFADPVRRRALEAITHPLIAARTRELLAAVPPDAIVVHDVPLLVERRMGAGYHLVVVASAPEPVRVARLVELRGMSATDARSRVAAQASDARRRAAADVWIDTDRDQMRVAADVRSLWSDRFIPFERNVRQAIGVIRPEPVGECVYDPGWPATAARLADRVAAAAGDLGRGVEHIGRTAVPGMAADGVIDLQLGVDSLDDADAVAADLARGGFPAADPGPGQRVERRHVGADPAVPVRLYLRVVGGPTWRAGADDGGR